MHATPPAPDIDDARPDTWRPCWWCGLPLDDDEHDLCAPCDADLNPLGERLILWAATSPDRAPLEHVLAFDEHQISMMTAAAIEHDVARSAGAAHNWALEHDLEPADASAYKHAALTSASRRLRARGAREEQAITKVRQLRRIAR